MYRKHVAIKTIPFEPTISTKHYPEGIGYVFIYTVPKLNQRFAVRVQRFVESNHRFDVSNHRFGNQIQQLVESDHRFDVSNHRFDVSNHRFGDWKHQNDESNKSSIRNCVNKNIPNPEGIQQE